MTCFHPLKAFPIGFHPSGKIKYKITSYDIKAVSIDLKKNTVACFDFVPLPVSGKKLVTDFIEIPCGRCKGCRLTYSRQWADRLMLELQEHEYAWFLTMTYDNEHLPENPKTQLFIDDIDSFADEYNFDEYTKNELKYNIQKGISSPLCKRDIQLFMKRLRKKFPDYKLRYFCAGEYGEKTGRPHYHMILYGLPLFEDDLELWSVNELKQPLYLSKVLTDVWQNGFVVVGQVSWESCAYTARYILKKQYGEHSADYYESLGLVPEFTLMSNKPGIARNFYENNKDTIYEHKFINLSAEDCGRRLQHPRYFDKLFAEEYPESMEQIKERRKKFAEEKIKKEMSGTSLTYLDYLKAKEDKFENKVVKKLKRNGDFNEKKNAEA